MAGVPSISDIMQPKFILATKRGWGMVITGLVSALPFVNLLIHKYTGIDLSVDMVNLIGNAGATVLDALGTAVGVVLWVWGSFRPTAPLTVKPGDQ